MTVDSGTLAATTSSGVTVGGTSSALTLEGTVSAMNGFLAAGAVTFTPAANDTANVTLGVLIDDQGHNGAGGGLTFTTAPDDTSTVALTITIDDQGHNGAGGPLTDTATVDLLVTAVNDPPTIDAPTTLSVTAGHPYPLQDLSFADAEAGDLDVEVTLTVDGGELAHSSSSSLAAGAPPDAVEARLTATGTPTALTLVGSVAELDAAFASGEVTYTADRRGTFTLTVTIDDRGAGVGPPEQATATVLLDAAAQPIVEVPTLGVWGRLVLLALLAGAALHQLRRA